MSRADHSAMILVIKGRAAEIDEVDLWAEQDFSEFRRPGREGTRGWNVAIICECLVVVVQQKNVFRFQVGVYEIEVVQEGDGAEQLPSESLNVGAGEGHKASALEEVED